MAGKTKQQKKRRAKMQKQVGEQLRRKPKKIVATQAGDEVNNNLEKSPPTVNEDTQKDAAMLSSKKAPEDLIRQRQETIQQLEDETADLQLEVDTEPVPEEIKVSEAEELASAKEQGESEREALEPKPFDPKDIVANALKKYGA